MRQCTGCREMKPKKELIRVVKSPDGDISIDFKGKKSGRGAYVCPDTQCLKRAIKARAFERAFDMKIPDEIYESLQGQMEAGDEE
ncbi:MAG: YlxR family protein [Ruminococcaceae bacterium]|nr:YlxR family protein [Oscillospiraceae bacterium]